MKVAIIGAGNVGRALGTSMSRVGHKVTGSAASTRAAATEIGASAASSNSGAARETHIAQARYLEGLAWITIGLNAANGWDWTSAWQLEQKG